MLYFLFFILWEKITDEKHKKHWSKNTTVKTENKKIRNVKGLLGETKPKTRGRKPKLETQPTETEGKQEKKKKLERQTMEMNWRRKTENSFVLFLYFLPHLFYLFSHFSTDFLFFFLNTSSWKPYPLHATKRRNAWASPRSAKDAGGDRQNKKRKILAQIF